MKNVASVLGRKSRYVVSPLKIDWPLPDQLMGIEIEVENIPGTKFPELSGDPSWSSKRDGSLRGGNEYVLSQPLSGDLLSKAINSFFSAEHKLHRSATGSTHIHVDMLEENTPVTAIQLMALLFFMLEPAIFGMYAPEREWCGFTNKLSSAPERLLGSILNVNLENGLPSVLDDGSVGRYYGLNMQALFKFGSVELRYFPTATTKDELIEWLMLAQQFKKAAVNLGATESLRNIMDDERTYKQFINEYFGQWEQQILEHVPYYHALQAFNKAQAIAESYQYYNQQPPATPVNPEVLFSKGKFSKFIKVKGKKQEAILPVIVSSSQDTYPPAEQCTPGQVLIYSRVAHVALPHHGWTVINSSIPSYLDQRYLPAGLNGITILRKVLASLNAFALSHNNSMDDRVRTNVTSCISHCNNAIQHIMRRTASTEPTDTQSYYDPELVREVARQQLGDVTISYEDVVAPPNTPAPRAYRPLR